ncbi:MAG: PAS domain-containing protein [Stellaceae bacterium]
MTTTETVIRTPLLQRLQDDWERRRRGREFPARADFDVLDMKYAMGNLTIVEVAYDPLRFRFRLHGSRISQRVGYDMTGKDIEALPPALAPLVRRHFEAVVEERRPIVEVRERQIADEGVFDSEVLALPLSRDGRTIDMLMVGVCFP